MIGFGGVREVLFANSLEIWLSRRSFKGPLAQSKAAIGEKGCRSSLGRLWSARFFRKPTVDGSEIRLTSWDW